MNERIPGRASAFADYNGYVNQYGLSRKVRAYCYSNLYAHRTLQHIFDSVKKSLDRLQLDYVDVLHCHEFDSETPIHETVRKFRVLSLS